MLVSGRVTVKHGLFLIIQGTGMALWAVSYLPSCKVKHVDTSDQCNPCESRDPTSLSVDGFVFVHVCLEKCTVIVQ